MKLPKYTDICVRNQINVSSSCHYFTRVLYRVNGSNFVGRDYWIPEGFLSHDAGFWGGAPNYLQIEVQKQLVKLLESGEAKFFEYDRDGNKRWTDLRYYDPAYIPTLIKVLSVDMGGHPRW